MLATVQQETIQTIEIPHGVLPCPHPAYTRVTLISEGNVTVPFGSDKDKSQIKKINREPTNPFLQVIKYRYDTLD